MTSTTTAPTASSRDETTARPSVGQRVGDFLLSLLALGGVVCIIAVICAFAFHISLIMFRTGSMSPTMPTGALAIVREIPASDVRVGDVTTIDRDEQLPVTHRVVAIEPMGGGTYSIRMKGDANATEDPQPYTVEKVRKVLWSIDGAGYLVAKVQNPGVMAVSTVVMAGLVTWVFWPKKRRRT